MKNHPWKKKPTTLLLLLSLLTIALLLLGLSQNKLVLITTTTSESEVEEDSCLGRYIYIHNLPSRFNIDILQDCERVSRPNDKISMCKYVENFGFGPPIRELNGDRVYSPSWYGTNQFMLEVIFHEKMKRYECLTRNSSLASAIFVPYYAGLDFRRNIRRRNVAERDAAGKELFKWLKKQPQWKGQDHFLVTGRISRDFRRNSDNNSGWGTNLMLLPESHNLSFLTIERSPASHNEFVIPYPTYFHPTSAVEILKWQDKIKLATRPVLFSFAGAQRPSRSRNGLVRTQVILQCKSSFKNCRFLDCDVRANSLMKLFESSVFCLQPPGFLVIALVTPSANATRKSVVLGGEADIPNVQTNIEIQELGRYCVEQFNLMEESEQGNAESIADTAVLNPLNFSRVVSAQKQVVAGLKYDLRIEVIQPDGTSRMFDSVVIIQPWLHSKKLLGFTPVATPVY
ncbi:hypothetical protein HID58_015895 [Brassica napus]|uniref:Cystatin domain-containing protein n=1 Tax=Brassica napus TaxID=3708 RepID=A0ABQ8DLS2_BRANA|nr:hypothetical protein HID58_015895 [Brassica napus]